MFCAKTKGASAFVGRSMACLSRPILLHPNCQIRPATSAILTLFLFVISISRP